MLAKKELFLISGAYLLAHFLTTLTGAYGYFRDELYYIACTNHLGWGYVDQPPFSIFVLALNRTLFGDSLFALRLLPAISGAAFVFVTGWIAAELGGNRFAQVLAAICVAIAPVYLSIFGFYSMNCFDLLFCAVILLVVLKILNSSNEKLWILFGLLVGFGLENKLSVLFLCIGLGVGLLLSPHRRQLISKWFWLGALVAIVINVPHILWQVQNHWPTLEFMRNATEHKNAVISPLGFFQGLALMMHPFTLMVWVPGLFALAFSAGLRQYRFLLIAFLTVTIIFILQNGKAYYVAPFFPALFAAGGIVWEKWTESSLRFLRYAVPVLLLIGGVLTAPFSLPFLPVETYIRYAKAFGIEPKSEERDRPGKLSQHYADMFGWKELAQTVAEVYSRLTPEEKSRCGIFAENYGEAGAIDFFGAKYGLPHAISGHNSYWLWGPGNATGEVMIVIGGDLEDHQPFYESCSLEATHRNEYARSFETDLGIFVCRKLKEPVSKVWPLTRGYI